MTNKDTEIIRVIIAEDEPPIGRFLRRLVEQTEGFSVAAVCLSGETAIEAVKEWGADLIITDIRMSGMSGLELIGRIKEQSGAVHSIIVTGHKTFEYAKEAISLGIDAFITKPIDQQELRAVLENIRRGYRSACADHLRQRLEAFIRARDEEAFYRSMPYERIRSLLIYYSGGSGDLTEVIQAVRPGLLYVQYKEAVAVFENADTTESDFDTIVRKVLCLKNRKRTCVCVQAEETPSDGSFILRLRSFYRNTVRRLVTPGKSCSCKFAAMEGPHPADYGEDGELFGRLELDILAKEHDRMQAGLIRLFENWREHEASLYHMRRQIHAISALMDRAGLLTWDKISVNDQIDESIVSQDSYEEIREAAVRCWRRSMQKRPETARNKDCHMFEQIKVFIEQNRNQNYSLQEICSIFKASPPYIRKVFKQYTGKSYNEYLLESKIDYAVRLMDANPHMFVKDIADMLGFEQLYFGTVFKKVTGVSPSQYRSEAMERKGGVEET